MMHKSQAEFEDIEEADKSICSGRLLGSVSSIYIYIYIYIYVYIYIYPMTTVYSHPGSP
jgi:hypothetical protein